MATAVGSHLLPMAYWHANDPKACFVYFHEERERAMKWGNSPLCSYSLYRCDSRDLEGLEPHPATPRIWRTAHPVPFSVLTVVERVDRGSTLPGLPEMLEKQARALGTLSV